MIFVIDVGNTNMTMGVFCGEKLAATFRIMTKTPRTSDEYGIMITQLLKNNGIEISDIEGAIIASVVPDVMHSLTSSIIRYLHTKPLIVGPGVKSGIKVATEDPRGIGADRIVDAVAAYVKYGGPVLVLDFGTATTYDLITEDGRFTAGITAPGIRISSEALWKETAKLPNIEIRKPKTILAHRSSTVNTCTRCRRLFFTHSATSSKDFPWSLKVTALCTNSPSPKEAHRLSMTMILQSGCSSIISSAATRILL